MSLETPYTLVHLGDLDRSGESIYRLRFPCRTLSGQAPQWRVLIVESGAAQRNDFIEAADLLIVVQSDDVDLLPLIAQRRKQGKKTLVEYNDNFYAPPSANHLYRKWSAPLVQQTYELFMEESDGVIVTCDGMAELLRAKTSKPVYVIENHLLEAPSLESSLSYKPTDEIRLAWAGSSGHLADLLMAAPTIKQLLSELPQLRFHFMGNLQIPQVLQLPVEQCRFFDWQDVEKYYQFWESVHIGLAPLIDTPYNACRSDIKAVEMCSRGVLPLLSNGKQYHHFFKATGTKPFNSLNELRDRVHAFVANPAKFSSQLSHCYTYATENRIAAQRKERLELYMQHLPTTPSRFSWPHPPGYSESKSTKRCQGIGREAYAKAEKLVVAGEVSQAKGVLEAAIKQTPFDAHLQLGLLQFFYADGSEDSLRKVNEVQTKFPKDIRFKIFQAVTVKDSQLCIKSWTDILDYLSHQSEYTKSYFQDYTLDRFIPQLRVCAELAPLEKAILSLYPNALELKLAFAEFHVANENFTEAAAHFNEILAGARLLDQNKKFLEKNQIEYLQVRCESLNALVERTK